MLIIHSGKCCADKPVVSAFHCHVIIIMVDLFSPSYSYHHHHHQFRSLRGLAGFQGVRVTDQALLIHYSGKSFLAMQHVLCISALCARIYIPGRRLSTYYYYYYYYYWGNREIYYYCEGIPWRPLVILVKVGWKQDESLGSEEGIVGM